MSSIPPGSTGKNGPNPPRNPAIVPFPEDRLPPQNIDAEKSVLGAVILDHKVMDDVAAILTDPEMFWRDDHQVIYRAMLDLWKAGTPIDAVILDEELRRRGVPDHICGPDDLSDFVHAVPHSANAAHHAEIVRKMAAAREAISLARFVVDEGFSRTKSPEDLANKLRRSVEFLENVYSPAEQGVQTIKGWPELPDPIIWHGLAGEVVEFIDPHTEADPIAILVQFLTVFGNIVGRNHYWCFGASEHHLNLYTCIVGNSAKARKGTSWDNVLAFYERCDATYVADRIMGGLSTAEGLIYTIRDPIVKNGQTVDEGVSDKRALFIESEFGSLLTVAAREGNTLIGELRKAWDGVDLRSSTKQSPMRASKPHVSIIGHVTLEDLDRRLTITDAANGFANRFLWVCAKRSKFLPEPVPIMDEEWWPVIMKLRDAVLYGSSQRWRMERTQAAKKLWADQYHERSEGGVGLLGTITGRGEAQVMRLACIYALLEERPIIEEWHLRAAFALWDYCVNSAAYIFGKDHGDPEGEMLLAAIKQAGEEGLKRSAIHSRVFRGHKSADEVLGALVKLERAGLVERRTTGGTGGKGGRPSEVWLSTSILAQKAQKLEREEQQ